MTAPDKPARAHEGDPRALKDAGKTPEDVVYVNAHGTSTPLNDRAETTAIKAALGDHATTSRSPRRSPPIGHLLGAAGAVEAVATILALRDRMAPPTLRLRGAGGGPGPQLRARTRPSRWTSATSPPLAISNAFGFGGHNVVLRWRPREAPWG